MFHYLFTIKYQLGTTLYNFKCSKITGTLYFIGIKIHKCYKYLISKLLFTVYVWDNHFLFIEYLQVRYSICPVRAVIFFLIILYLQKLRISKQILSRTVLLESLRYVCTYSGRLYQQVQNFYVGGLFVEKTDSPRLRSRRECRTYAIAVLRPIAIIDRNRR